MNEMDRQNREVVRQSRMAGAGNRLSAGSAGSVAATPGISGTRAAGGAVKRLFLIDHDQIDDPTKYLGNRPLSEEL